MYFYLYQIINKLNDKIYVGVHKTDNLNDGYMGSGKILNRAIKKYGVEKFEKDILIYFNTAEEMFAKEKEIVTDEFLLREDTYNLRRGGNGGFDYINKDKELLIKRNTKIARNRDHSSQVASIAIAKTKDSYRKNMSIAQKQRFKDQAGTFAGKNHSENTKKIMSDAAKKRLADPTKNSQFGTMWITDGVKNKKILKNSIVPNGWYKGRNLGRVS